MDPDKLSRASPTARWRENYAALEAGDIDVMQAFEPFVSMAEQDGAGEVLYAGEHARSDGLHRVHRDPRRPARSTATSSPR